MFQTKDLDRDKIWNVVRKVKLESSSDKGCDRDGLYFSDDKIWGTTMSYVEQQLGISSSSVASKQMTKEYLKIAADMFFYLYSCPGETDKKSFMNTDLQKWFQAWFRFYNDLFKTKSPRQIILTLNRLTKANSIHGKTIQLNQKLFKRTATLLMLKYEDIQKMFAGSMKLNSSNETIPNLKADGKVHTNKYTKQDCSSLHTILCT